MLLLLGVIALSGGRLNVNKTKLKENLKNNYWIQPLLLVALIFVIIFALQFIPKWRANWVAAHTNPTGCDKCVTATLKDVNDHIAKNEDFYVFITQETCANCAGAYPIVNKFLTSYPQYKVYLIDVEYHADTETYNDETITDENLYEFGKLVDIAVTSAGEASIYDATTDEYGFLTPSLIQFVAGKPSDALIGVDDYGQLAEFFGESD